MVLRTLSLEMGTHHYRFRCNMVTPMIRPQDRWASLVYPHHCHQPRGISASNRTLSAADNRRCQATCQFQWVAFPSSRHRQRRVGRFAPTGFRSYWQDDRRTKIKTRSNRIAFLWSRDVSTVWLSDRITEITPNGKYVVTC